ncbi:calcium-translocating P-type ATPase, PMCA-type [Clostridium sp. LP20]|uniref:calcium-translocating P-type ATPase, PMCA-type n=1 Tax=Clostridium sp. LP20 TaxID=3418665 RepID=UPI003EE52A7C
MWFSKSSEEAIKEFVTDPLNGLSSEEAKKRLERDGENKLAGKKKKTILSLFLAQLKDAMIYILIGAAIISGIMGEISDSIIILIVILINAVIGVVQESKAEKALEALKQLSTPKALVKRDGELKEIPSEEVVIGDIVIIDAGRYIPADLRLIESANLKMEESAFTGESLPSDKDATVIVHDEKAPIGDRHNMAFMSTLATYGRGSGIVVATGMNTEIGKIAKMLDAEEESATPLQKRLAQLGKTLGFAAIGICVLIFVISIFQGRDWFEMLLTAISLAVAAIPEGLPAIVAIVLALGVQRMIKQNAIVKKLPAVETLGSVSIICSDKTGTLTINKMTVKKTFVNNKLESLDTLDINNHESKLLVEAMVLCNDATSTESSKTGDPTEIALLDVGIKFNIFKDNLNTEHKRVDEIPFDSDRKLMTTVNSYGDGFKVFTKGAIDSLFKICDRISINGEIQPLTEEKKKELLDASNAMSDDALRVLGASYKDITNQKISLDKLEEGLIFIGLMGMIDPPREEVKGSIELCKKAGIVPIMITGDHKNTAFAIGKELGIADNLGQSMSGAEIDNYSQDEFNAIVNNYKIFARVSPEHKVKIVKAFKSHGNIVSMTGDGVNDAPSLKAADIGVAMGITGTDVAKGAADMILTDDNFSTIVNAVEEGRNIYSNIKKSIIFLLSCNFGEIVALFVAILLNWATPLLPIHILWVNLITDSFPALSLGVDPMDESVMDDPPRNPKESLFAGHMGLYLAVNGILIGTLTLFAFKLGEHLYPDSLMHAQTMAFVVLSVSQLFFSLNMRNTKKSIFSLGLFSNKYLIGSIVFGILIQFAVITIPFLAGIFKVYPLSFRDWGLVLLISIMPLVINEILKIFLRIKKN